MHISRHLLAALVAAPFAAAAGSAPAEPLKLHVAWVVPVTNLTSMLFNKEGVAKHLGQSYDYEAARFQGSPPMITALATGDLQIGLLGYSALGLAVQNAGMSDLRIIADEIRDGAPGYFTNGFVVANDSGVKTVADLKGKVIATNAAGSSVDIAVRAMLVKAGLDDKKDVTIVEASFPNMKAMLKEKKIVFAPAVLPFSEDPELVAANHVLFTQRDALGPSALGFLVARGDFLTKNRAAVVDFLEDYLRMVRWYSDPANHAEGVEIASKFSKLPAAVFDRWVFTKGDYYRDPNGTLDVEAIQSNVDLTQKLGFIKAKLDVKKLVDLSLVEEAAKRIK
jgi:sulfonate transport system substrate-binding protein